MQYIKSNLVQITAFQSVLLLLLCLLSFFINNGYLDVSIMEARNYITAREMIIYDNWLIPTLNGAYRLAKPPLPTWITALAGLMSDNVQNEAVLRFPSAVMGLVMVYFLYRLTQLFTNDRLIPFIAAGILASSFNVIFLARQGTWDIYCHSFMLAAIYYFTLGIKKKPASYRYFVLAGILIGLAFMSKGPVPLFALLLPYLMAYFIAFGISELKGLWVPITILILVSLIISSWWPIYTYLHVPDHLMESVAVETNSWQNRHVRPFWHYWNFPIQSGAWTVLLTVSLIFPYAKSKIKNVSGNYRFLFGWVAITIILLSLVPEKKERYLMPGLISQSLLTAFYLKYLIESFQHKTAAKLDYIIFYFNTFLMGIICIGASVGLFVFGMGKENLPLPASIIFIIILLILGGFFLYQLKKKNIMNTILAIFLLTGMVSSCLPYFINESHLTASDQPDLREISKRQELKTLPFYHTGIMRPEEYWDLEKVVTSVDNPDTLSHLNKGKVLYFRPVSIESLAKSTMDMIPDNWEYIGLFAHPSSRKFQRWKVYLVNSGDYKELTTLSN